ARTTPLLLGAATRARRPDTVAHVMTVATAAAPQSVAWAQRAVAVRPDSTEVLRSADIPAVVIAGEEDELVSVDEARSLAQALPRGRLVTVCRAGHLLPLEAPDLVTQILMSLLDESATAEPNREGAC
ncbi:MAG: alpha/beta fold hydrolase, partial [Pseudonocardiaceae bacterium]